MLSEGSIFSLVFAFMVISVATSTPTTTSTPSNSTANFANLTTEAPLLEFDENIRKSAKALSYESYMVAGDTARKCYQVSVLTNKIKAETDDASDEVASDSDAAEKDSMFSYGYVMVQVTSLYDVIRECNESFDETSQNGSTSDPTIWEMVDVMVDEMESGEGNVFEIKEMFEAIKNSTALYDQSITSWAKQLNKLALNVETAMRDAYKMVREDPRSGEEAIDDAKDALTEVKYFANEIITLSTEMEEHKDEIYKDIDAYIETVDKGLEKYEMP